MRYLVYSTVKSQFTIDLSFTALVWVPNYDPLTLKMHLSSGAN